MGHEPMMVCRQKVPNYQRDHGEALEECFLHKEAETKKGLLSGAHIQPLHSRFVDALLLISIRSVCSSCIISLLQSQQQTVLSCQHGGNISSFRKGVNIVFFRLVSQFVETKTSTSNAQLRRSGRSRDCCQ